MIAGIGGNVGFLLGFLADSTFLVKLMSTTILKTTASYTDTDTGAPSTTSRPRNSGCTATASWLRSRPRAPSSAGRPRF
jgi:hypothetical protein